MDAAQLPSRQSPSVTLPPTDLSGELAHINHEIYKKSVELAETNKTLLILRKINEIIFSSATTLVADAKFKIVSIFIPELRSIPQIYPIALDR